MGKRLPPGEAERRKRERAKATWSGANYKRYDPKDGHGSHDQWAGTAQAFANGDTVMVTPVNADLAILGLSEMPDKRGLNKVYRNAVAAVFKRFGSDTAPGYAEAFLAVKEAYDRVKIGQGW